MPSTDDELPVQALTPYRSDPALGEGVRPRSTEGSVNRLCSLTAEHLIEGPGVLGVPVMDEEPGRLTVIEREEAVPRLLGDPSRVGMGRHAPPTPGEWRAR
jgi:hypothetical protein